MKNIWEKFYKNTPLNSIPWQKTQADWFCELINNNVIKGNSVLDLGCGTGKKSVYLAKHGFKKVIGVDISKTAIEYAKKNALDHNVQKKITFYTHDVSDLSFLNSATFDLILDWATLHCIPIENRNKYIQEVIKHTHKNTTLLLRAFSKEGNKEEHFKDPLIKEENKIYLFNRNMIEELYSKYFNIVNYHKSLPKVRTMYSFDEYLMIAK